MPTTDSVTQVTKGNRQDGDYSRLHFDRLVMFPTGYTSFKPFRVYHRHWHLGDLMWVDHQQVGNVATPCEFLSVGLLTTQILMDDVRGTRSIFASG